MRVIRTVLEVPVEVLQFFARRRRCISGGSSAPTRRFGQPQLVGHHLHRHCEVQRAESGVGRNRQQCGSDRGARCVSPDFSGPNTTADCAVARFSSSSRAAHSRGAMLGQPMARDLALAPGDVSAVGKRLVERVDNPHAVLQQVLGAGGAGGRVLVREIPRPDQCKIVQSHVLHRARDRTDIAGMRGADEDDADSS